MLFAGEDPEGKGKKKGQKSKDGAASPGPAPASEKGGPSKSAKGSEKGSLKGKKGKKGGKSSQDAWKTAEQGDVNAFMKIQVPPEVVKGLKRMHRSELIRYLYIDCRVDVSSLGIFMEDDPLIQKIVVDTEASVYRDDIKAN